MHINITIRGFSLWSIYSHISLESVASSLTLQKNVTNCVCAVDLDRDVAHVNPLVSRLKETGDLFLCISIQLLQGAADTYAIKWDCESVTMSP